jgi:hypothetical protein
MQAGLGRLDDTEILRWLRRGTKSGDPLGFGLGESVVLVTPIVWVALHEAADVMTDAAEAGIRARIGARIRRKRSRSRPSKPLPHFSGTQLRVVRARAVELARNAGMEAVRAERLARRGHPAAMRAG